MFNPFADKKKNTAFVNERRAHVVVNLGKQSHRILSTEIVGKFEPSEVGPAVEATLRRIDALSSDIRAERIETLVSAAKKKVGMMDKLARRAGKWESQARAAVKDEVFTGAGAAVKVVVGGDFGLREVQTTAATAPDVAFASARDAMEKAFLAADARWNACLEGALDVDVNSGQESEEGSKEKQDVE